jgi:glycosyltransferase involved in cell wall biosynthesis
MIRKKIYNLYNLIFSKVNTIRYYCIEKFLYLKNKKKSKYILMKKSPLISIIMPTYNRCEILSKIGIPTVLKQTYKNFELIIVSHGSTDQTKSMVNKISDNRVKFFQIKREQRYPPNIENHWACHSVDPTNFGLKVIKGDWISHLDDDDIWTKDHLEKLLNFALKNKYEFVSSSHLEIRYGRKKIIDSSKKKPPIGSQHTWLYTSNLSFFKRNINAWRRNWNRIHDVDVADRMVKVGLNFGYLNEVTYIAQPRPGEKQIGIRAMRENEKFYDDIYKFS